MMNNVVNQRIIEPDEQNCYAVYTVVRHEKSVNAALADKDIDTFLPIRKKLAVGKIGTKRFISPVTKLVYNLYL